MSTFTHVMSGFTIALAVGVLSTGLFSGVRAASSGLAFLLLLVAMTLSESPQA
ncbi:hypothetical protein [Hyalangium rubrum]|uniref:Uncharacterized protein n=1 Tax=Hyalangium rubrum TaxID=3103134 RepID=A0ABU5H8R3_9BACT|nr:hypothetical protein [Hyalangium sp. s54d21]MDY7229695.1 hypothetical protein [Hyalangium sp. s54d21]